MGNNKLPVIWNSNLAYVVGLIATDGNLSKDGRHVTMRSSDFTLLETFRNCLKRKDKIAQSYNNGFAKKPSYRVQFSDAHFYRWLLKIGLTPAKTYTIGEIKLPNLLFRDFLRGHLDGDGSVYTYLDRYNYYHGRIYTNRRLYVVFISASHQHIIWLQKKISELAGTIGAIIRKAPPDKIRVPMWTVKFSKKESIRLLNWIYYQPHLPCLERKRQLAQNILEKIATEKRKVYTKINHT